jgi:hypothetical protein
MDSKITKREHFASMALQGILMSQNLTLHSIETISISRMKVLTNMAVDAADLLIAALEETPVKEKSMSIFDAGFSRRILTKLSFLAIENWGKDDMTLFQLSEFSENDLLASCCRIGNKSLREIKDVLALHNLRLRHG